MPLTDKGRIPKKRVRVAGKDIGWLLKGCEEKPCTSCSFSVDVWMAAGKDLFFIY